MIDDHHDDHQVVPEDHMDVDEIPIPEVDDPDTPPEIANDTVHEIRKTMDDAPQMVTNIIAYSHSSTNSNNFF